MGDVLDAAEKYNTQPLTQEKAAAGLKEALSIGIVNAATKASSENGFYGNQLIKIPFPPEIHEVEQKLRTLGLGNQVDKFILSLNDAAELASAQASPIFKEAILNMSIVDAIKILRGPENAATLYLEDKTRAQLMQAFMPEINNALNKIQVNQYWTPLATTYNALPFTSEINPDLADYVANRAVDGLFVLLAQEEAKIRSNPAARVTDLLKEVFGYTFN